MKPARDMVRHVLDSYGAHEGDEWSGITGRENLINDLYVLFSADSTCGGCQGRGAHSRACVSPLRALAESVESLGDSLSPVLANRAWRAAEQMRELASLYEQEPT